MEEWKIGRMEEGYLPNFHPSIPSLSLTFHASRILMKIRELYQVRQGIDRRFASLLVLLPIVIVLALYFYGSYKRHQENPRERMMPNLGQIKQGVVDTIKVNERTGNRWLWVDLKRSLYLMAVSMGLTVAAAVFVGLHIACFAAVEALHLRFVRFASFIPPLALLPLIFIFVGTGDGAKILLIFLGTYFILVMDVYLRCKEVPMKLIQKAYTMGASTQEVVYKVVLRYAWPGILNSIRFSFRQAWIYLIAAEMIAADAGLGYRIILVQRQIGVNIILWYLFIIGTIGFATDFIILKIIQTRYAWSLEK